ncbi:cupin domain-containing protein [Lutibacter sp.]|uniref:cupin domain-containing protein n=1 Tax=Lutibacter sp. TaxID=1925666 RepID=UPI0025BDCF1B|nr:cupin domain-containing protein [Lutibacter sp.]MCF6168289.1 cupin domain-containing protein [Lutibacter sp.]
MLKEILKIQQKEIIKGFKGRFFHTNNFTIAFWEIEKGAILPEHSHIHEQTTQVIEGKLEMTIDNKTMIVKAGMIVHIPSNAKHSGKALTNCKLTDTFYPIREDYKFNL